ncbi:MAG TPA: glycosyltransferase [Methylotenera sp.]|nr:glycosyltransferase [Methylotenera sp.]HPH05867.1 glycosyltransferase [Methylotenera sp.]HPN00649.1 glycosyltransferase [Methylotenera sp.]
MKNPHILVLSVSAGAGHVRAAQALVATAERDYPHANITHLDVMDFVPSSFRKVYADSYIKLVDKAPLLWAYLYQNTDKQESSSLLTKIRRNIERLNTRDLKKEIKKIAPDAIICTHFLPAELASRRIEKGEAMPPVWVQVTDFDVHGLWVHPHIQGYFVASDEVAARLQARGIAAEHIKVSGIPIMPQFSIPLNPTLCANEIGINPNKLTLIMMSGGLGVGNIANMAQALLQLPNDFQMIALAGKNEKMLHDLQQLSAQYPGRLFAMGFTKTIERLMAVSDLAITKPGGLTSSECLAMHLPMIAVSPIPGQEERNADYLLESGAALKAVDIPALCYKVQKLTQNPVLLNMMRERMSKIAKPTAANMVLSHVLGTLEA